MQSPSAVYGMMQRSSLKQLLHRICNSCETKDPNLRNRSGPQAALSALRNETKGIGNAVFFLICSDFNCLISKANWFFSLGFFCPAEACSSFSLQWQKQFCMGKAWSKALLRLRKTLSTGCPPVVLSQDFTAPHHMKKPPFLSEPH